MLRWVQEGRSSIVVGLAAALAVPSVNTVVFDGVPFGNAWEVAAVLALLPFVFSAGLRERLGRALDRHGDRGKRAALVGIAIAIVLKLLLLGFGDDRGFVGCYASTWKPPPQPCEKSYSNIFGRHGGATRVDQELDFGPSAPEGSDLVTAPAIPVEREGVATTDWELGFANDLRFNEGSGEPVKLRALMPFAVGWTGTAAIPEDGRAIVTYAGSGKLEVGGRSVPLPESPSPRTIRVSLPPGDQPLRAEFTYEAVYRAPFAEFRLLNDSGDPISAAAPALVQQAGAAVAWLILAVLFAGLAIVALSALGGIDLALLAGVAAAAVLLGLLTDGFQGFQYLIAAIAPILVLRNGRHPILWAYAALAAILAVGVIDVAGHFDAIVYRGAGSDFLTYESYAREIVLNGSLRGGEDVFFYQPGSRYALGAMHLLWGDGDALVAYWSMLGITLSFAALLVWHRRLIVKRNAVLGLAAVGFLLFATLASPTCLSIVAVQASEVPTWALLPLAVAAPQLRPSRSAAWLGSAAAAGLIWVTRNNQGFGVLLILASMAAAIGRRRRRLLLAGAAVVVAIAMVPVIHNLAYGQALDLTATSGTTSRVHQFGLLDLPHVFDSTPVGSEIRGHIGSIFYDPPIPGITEASFGRLLYALLAVWLAAVALAFARRRRRELTASDWILLGLPVAYLLPHVVYQVEVFYPRHIVAGYLAMGVGAIGAFSAMGRVGR
jgi:hypothetical protein